MRSRFRDMLKFFRSRISRLGQAISSEYALTYVLVVITLIAMGVYVRRVVLARIRDARIHMSGQIRLKGYKGNIWLGYEPYYAQADGTRRIEGTQQDELLGSQETSGIFQKFFNETTETKILSNQLSPRARD